MLKTIRFVVAAVLAALVVAPAVSQDVRNTYVGVTAQIADGIITTAKFASTTGTAGTAVVLATSPTLTTPTIGVATATSVNKVAITAPATSATLTITDGQTLSYQEGTWTPTYIGSSTAGTGQTYVIQVGSYEKIGRQVTARFYLQASSLGTAAGNIQLGGLPFTSTAVTNDWGTCSTSYTGAAGLAASQYGVMGAIAPSTAYVNWSSMSNTSSSLITVAQAGAGFTLIGVCNYRT